MASARTYKFTAKPATAGKMAGLAVKLFFLVNKKGGFNWLHVSLLVTLVLLLAVSLVMPTASGVGQDIVWTTALLIVVLTGTVVLTYISTKRQIAKTIAKPGAIIETSFTANSVTVKQPLATSELTFDGFGGIVERDDFVAINYLNSMSWIILPKQLVPWAEVVKIRDHIQRRT